MDDEPLSTASGSLGRRMTKGAAWMVGLHFVDRFIGLLSTIVLARLLVPADFGLVALAMAMMAAVAVFSEFGLELALIQKQDAQRSHYDTAWTLGLLRGGTVAVLVVLAAAPVAAFFDNPALESVVLAFAIGPVLESLSNIGTVAFRKDLTLNKEFVYRIIPRLGGVAVTIALAFAWQNYWALVAGTLFGKTMRVALSYVMHSYRPQITLVAWRDIMSFSKWIVIIGIATYANRKLSTVLIAKFLDAASVGMFAIASQISNLAAAELIAPIKQVLFPGYAKIAHDTAALRKAFIDAYGILVLVTLPVAIGVGLTADYYVPLLLGSRWEEAIPLIEILVISGGLRSLSSHVRPVYFAMNRPRLGAYASVGRAILFLPILYFALSEYGLFGAAIAHAVAQVGVLFGSLYYMHSLLGVSLADLMRASWRALTACLLMTAAVLALKAYPPVQGDGFAEHLILLLSSVILGASVYIGADLLLWWSSRRPVASAEAYVLSFVRAWLQRRRLPLAGASVGKSA